MFSHYCHLAKKLAIVFADSLLDEAGNLVDLKEVEAPPVFFEGEYNSSDIEEHLVKVLDKLKTDRELRALLQRCSPLFFDPQVEEMIAITIGIDSPIEERHVKWAVLSALFTPLRQSVGSCFATAPAILVHEEQPRQFLEDLCDLLAKGRLSRTFGGVEYTVPMSPSPGLSDLKKPYQPDHPAFAEPAFVEPAFVELEIPPPQKGCRPSFLELIEAHVDQAQQQRVKWKFVAHSNHLLLKIWEFTIASFVDVKTEFSRWNLYSSLGLHPEEKGGIGALIYSYLEGRLEEANEELSKHQVEWELAFDQVRATESLMRNISSEQEGRRLKAEHQARLFHLQACERERNLAANTVKRISNFFSFMIGKIVEGFQEHFQEVYDAEMQEFEATPYDDAPAGFRLLYKHGRSHVAAWTFIGDGESYLQALKAFFIVIEQDLIHNCEWEQGKTEIGEIITAIIHHIHTEEFLTSAFYRMAKAHHTPLQEIPLEKMEKKPWAYTSGGTMTTLIKAYFRREGPLSEEARWVESAQDLCIFLLDTLKMLSPHTLDSYLSDPKKRMLATSPTHAFSLLPGEPLLAEGWQDRGFTYTWVRDQILVPRQEFYCNMRLKPQEQLYLVQELAKRMPPHRAHQLQSHFKPSHEKELLSLFRGELPPHPEVDGFLFEMLPLISVQKARDIVETLDLKIEPPSFPVGRRELHDLVTRNHHDQTATLFEEEGLAPPPPLRFADSNWEKFYFSFIVNPATGELELWRTDKIGLTGRPMREWEPFLNGTLRQAWSVYFRPWEYTS